MFNPNTTTIADALSSITDISLVIGIVIVGWKARSWFQPVLEFFNDTKSFVARANQHMETVEDGLSTMEEGMQILLGNHLRHIQADLKTISGRKTDYISADASDDFETDGTKDV
jgi:hypothetical protein